MSFWSPVGLDDVRWVVVKSEFELLDKRRCKYVRDGKNVSSISRVLQLVSNVLYYICLEKKKNSVFHVYVKTIRRNVSNVFSFLILEYFVKFSNVMYACDSDQYFPIPAVFILL